MFIQQVESSKGFEFCLKTQYFYCYGFAQAFLQAIDIPF